MGDFVVVPLYSKIASAFPHDAFFVDLCISGSMIGMMAGSVIAGVAAKRIASKHIATAGIILYSAMGGLCYVFSWSVAAVAVFRLIMGASYGLVIPSAYNLIDEFYETERDRGRMIGFFNASMGVVGMFTTGLSGFLGTFSWQSSFLLYLIAAPVAVLVQISVPTKGISSISDEDEVANYDQKRTFHSKSIPSLAVVLICSFFGFNCIYNSGVFESSFVALTVSDDAIELASLFASAATIGGVLSSLLFDRAAQLLGDKIPPVVFVMLSAGMLVVAFGGNALLDVAGYFVLGIGCGTGPLALHIAPRVKKLIAFDYGTRMLEKLRENAKAAGIGNIETLQGSWYDLEPGEGIPLCDVAITRWSPAQGDILKFSRCARRWCWSISSVELKFSEGGFQSPGSYWCRSTIDESLNTTPRPCGRKFGLNVHFNLLYDHGANPSINYLTDVRRMGADTFDNLVEKVLGKPADDRTEDHILQMRGMVERDAHRLADGTWEYVRTHMIAIMGWDPNEVVL